MSKYEMRRLNGCNISAYIEQPDYPHCESYAFPSVEMRFANSPIPFETINKKYNWAAPGDCARLNAEVAKGKGFNGRPLETCELTQKVAGTASTLTQGSTPITR
jgi:hypothetical protein